jgi:hypothetical protein
LEQLEGKSEMELTGINKRIANSKEDPVGVGENRLSECQKTELCDFSLSMLSCLEARAETGWTDPGLGIDRTGTAVCFTGSLKFKSP